MQTTVEVSTINNGIITFSDWSVFNEKIDNLTDEAFLSEENLCHQMEIDFEQYQKVVRFAIMHWKHSPSQSLFLGLGLNGLKSPGIGEAIFKDYLSQTRFLLMLSKARITNQNIFRTIRNEANEKVKVRGEYALTYSTLPEKREKGEKTVNETIQILYLYFLYCKKQELKSGFKKAKKIYRGIRIRDILNLPLIKEALKELHQEPYSRDRRKREYECIVQVLKEHGIQDICENSMVSFTSSKTVAKYFANNEGIIVEVNTDDVEIMTSEAHDIRFTEKDMYSNKCEREYILRVGKKLAITDVILSDLDYYIAMNSPLAVSMFDHDDKSATYVLNDVRIKVYYVWTSNTTSAIRYRNLDEDNWGMSSKEFKDKFGFSPIISNKNMKDIREFQIHLKN